MCVCVSGARIPFTSSSRDNLKIFPECVSVCRGIRGARKGEAWGFSVRAPSYSTRVSPASRGNMKARKGRGGGCVCGSPAGLCNVRT